MTTDRGASPADAQVRIAHLLAAAAPAQPRALGSLIGRLEAEGRLHTIRAGRALAGPAATPLAAVEVRGIEFDSRRVAPGSVFVAVPGAHSDGHDYVGAAERLGAAAAIVERPVAAATIPQLVVDRSQFALATAAAWWYGDPSHDLGIVGITGTDGKTTTSFLTVGVLEAAGLSSGLLTTAELKVGDIRAPNPEHVTTPEAPALQASLRAMASAGNVAAVVETTSHGLALERVGGIAYDVAVLTNLTHEHLEFHGSFEAYRDAKLSLFRRLAAGQTNPLKHLARPWPKAAVVNADDPAGELFGQAAAGAGATVYTYGTDRSSMIRATAVEEDSRRLAVAITTGRWNGRVELKLAGRFNVHNALAAFGVGEALELDPELIRAGLEGVAGVPGRMQRVDSGQPFGVIVDYAHSPASLQKVLDLLAPLAAARGGGLIAVFGSGGERDVQKRPMMGRIASERCRLVVVTNEDPRGEDPDAILEEIAAGAIDAGGRRGHDLLVIADRREAIEAAFERARSGDMVLLAGKGHEQTIIMADGPHPWDERSEAIRALESLGYRGD